MKNKISRTQIPNKENYNKSIYDFALGSLVLFTGYSFLIFGYKWIKKKLMINKSYEIDKILTDRDTKLDDFIIKYENSIPSEISKLILSSDMSTLANLIKNGKVTSLDAVITYGLRIAIIGRSHNLIADIDLENAISDAKMADFKVQNKDILGPLHGVPISIKDNFDVYGLRSTSGYSYLCNNIALKDSYIVSILRSKGAIVLTKSNIPQGLFAIESSNKIWGAAINPRNPKKTVGGSSGGEGGLIAAKCVPCGIGSDIGGSIRIPAAFCGVYGFKPTSVRVSNHGCIGMNGTYYGNVPQINVSYGPIGRSIDDLIYLCKCLFGEFQDDPYVLNLPYKEREIQSIDNNMHNIGYIVEYPDVEILPEIKETIMDVVNKLKELGYNFIEIKSDKFAEIVSIGIRLLINSNVFESIEKCTENYEEMFNFYENVLKIMRMSSLKKFIYNTILNIKGEQRASKFFCQFKSLSLEEYIKLSRYFLELKNNFLKYYKDLKLIGIISPVYPIHAINLNASKDLTFLAFTFIYNLLDMPAGVIPIKFSTKFDYKDIYNDIFTKLIINEMKEKISLPICIQVAGLPLTDENVLSLMKEIDANYRFDLVDINN